MSISFSNIFSLTKRHMKCYFRDKASVFFSFLSPLIVLILYILFIGDLQGEGVAAILKQLDLDYNPDMMNAFISSWLICGVMATSIITVTLGSSFVIVTDKVKGISKDFSIAPVSKISVFLSYAFSVFLISLIINSLILVIGQVYILVVGGVFIGFIKLLAVFGVLVLSLLSATLIIIFIVSIINSEATYSAFSAILGTVIGFFIGAYMPINIFPSAIQAVSSLIPASHSNAIFKNLIMEDQLRKLIPTASEEVFNVFRDNMSINIYFGDTPIAMHTMFVVLVASIFVFLIVNALWFKRKQKLK